jgi:hypothetical protein
MDTDWIMVDGVQRIGWTRSWSPCSYVRRPGVRKPYKLAADVITDSTQLHGFVCLFAVGVTLSSKLGT